MKAVFLRSLLATLFVSAGVYFYYQLPNVTGLKQRNPKITALMKLRHQENKNKNIKAVHRQTWVPYGAVSKHLKQAVLVSEDATFFSHNGVDVRELKAALKKDWETMSFARGGSTITMQLAKNLYLSPSKSPLRKLKEIVIAHQLELALSKRRIFEIYLNVVEWGPNIYGIESAARHYFDKSAAALDPLEAATAAALLPSPRNYRDRSVLNRRNVILRRLANIGYLGHDEYQRAIQAPLHRKVERATPLPLQD